MIASIGYYAYQNCSAMICYPGCRFYISLADAGWKQVLFDPTSRILAFRNEHPEHNYLAGGRGYSGGRNRGFSGDAVGGVDKDAANL
jgi:hypothetical protein